jgi:multiple antibiotic resistance protein
MSVSLAMLSAEFLTLLAMINPVGNLARFIAYAGARNVRERNVVAGAAGAAVGVTLLVAAWWGLPALGLLGISLPAFRVAGGIVVFRSGLALLGAGGGETESSPERGAGWTPLAVAVVPLAIPSTAGPGAIATTIVLAHSAPGALHGVCVSLVCLAVAATMTGIWLAAGYVVQVLGNDGVLLVSRLSGLLVCSMAVSIITPGLYSLFPVLAHP